MTTETNAQRAARFDAYNSIYVAQLDAITKMNAAELRAALVMAEPTFNTARPEYRSTARHLIGAIKTRLSALQVAA